MQNKIQSRSRRTVQLALKRPLKQVVKQGVQVSMVGLALIVTGCATTNQAEQPVSRTTALPQTAELPEGSVRYDTNDARVAQLWSAAEQARLEANTDMALQHLFEALEISPQNSLLWSRAAEIQLNNQQASMAENLALKSNTFAGDNASLLHRNWLIIEHARSMRGDLLGVRSAHKKVQEYRYR